MVGVVMSMLKKLYLVLFVLGFSILMPTVSWAFILPTPVFINEIHYDNAGTDAGEAIEIAGPSWSDLSGWSLVLYNGNGGASYNTRSLSGVIPVQQNGYGTIVFSYPTNGIQNGSPDGIALVDPHGYLLQFLSYEGSFTAVGGPADGLTSTDMGVSESYTTPVGYSLQLTGTGSAYSDFTWSAVSNTFGGVNTGQTFTGAPSVPEPTALSLFLFGLLGTGLLKRRKKS